MIHLVTFSDDKRKQSAQVCKESALQNGVDKVEVYDPGAWDGSWDWCDTFQWLNEETLKNSRGSGYWLWKPWIIANHIFMMELKDGDFLIYSDAGVKWIANVNEIISRMDESVFLFSNGHQHVHWCKADIMHGILGKQIDDSYTQVQASVIFFKVNDFTRKFIKEWLLFCQMPGWIDDSISFLPSHPEFAENRHDQAILSTLAYKYKIKQHWWPDQLWYESQRYRWPQDTYPSMLIHHRKRDKGKGEGKNPEWE